jgi:molybdopterin molybdotransferase
MRSVEEHLRQVLADIEPLEPLELPLADALGCVLAKDVRATWPLPSFDNSSMDGYAVQAADLTAASEAVPVRLKVVDDVPAGDRARIRVEPGTAVRIMTGAPMPDGADAVVPVEWTDAGTDMVVIGRTVDPGAHIRRAGEDIASGARALRAGTVIGPRQIAVLAAVGLPAVAVRPRPRVVVLSTGDELVDPGTQIRYGQVIDSNGVMLAMAAQAAGAQAFRAGPVPDDEDVFLRTVEDQLIRADLIITSGGVSMGAYDTVKAVLSKVGTVDFVKVAMQPGMPQGFGVLGPDRVPIFTLPGNPVSAYISFEVFVRPVIRRMLGHTDLHRPAVRAVNLASFTSPAGKTQFARASLSVDGGRYVVTPVGSQGSHILGGLAKSDAVIVVPPDVTNVPEGETVTVMDMRT